MSETKTIKPHVISSFAAPTAEDLAYFDSLTPDEQRELILAELDKTEDGNTTPWTPELSKDLFAQGVDRARRRHEAN